MTNENSALQRLIDKDAIRELVLLYSRAIDRKDVALLQTLYTADATDTHGDSFDGSAADYCAFIAKSLPYIRYSGHHVCNHLLSVDGDEGEGEVYALAYHVIPDGPDKWAEDLRVVRYIDRYRKEEGCWRFAKRVVTYDYASRRPANVHSDTIEDPSYRELASGLFKRGARAG